MVQIISFPYDGMVGRLQETGLKASGKTYWVGQSPDNCLKALGQPITAPDLMIIDFELLRNLSGLAFDLPEFKFLEEIPTLIIYNGWPLSGLPSNLRVIGSIPVKAQFEPEKFAQAIAAFYSAKEATAGRPVQRADFQKFLPDAKAK